MYQYRLYNSNDIENLKHNLECYKNTVKKMESGESLAEHSSVINELQQLKIKYSNLKGEIKKMEERYQEKILSYERKEQNISTQIKFINHSVTKLRQDVNIIKNGIDAIHFSDLLNKMNYVIKMTDDHLKNINKEINLQKEAFVQLKDHTQAESKPIIENSRTSEYRQIQNMLNSVSKNVIQPKQNNLSMKPASKRFSANPNTRITKPINNNIIQSNKEKKVFHSPKYELNKNIITRTDTSKTRKSATTDKVISEMSSQSNDNSNHQHTSNNLSYEKNHSDHPNDRNTESTVESNNDKLNKDNQETKISNKTEPSSFFSFFKKRESNHE